MRALTSLIIRTHTGSAFRCSKHYPLSGSLSISPRYKACCSKRADLFSRYFHRKFVTRMEGVSSEKVALNVGQSIPTTSASSAAQRGDSNATPDVVEKTENQGPGPISKRQQKKLLRKEAAKQYRVEKKIAKKEESKLKAAAKRKELDEKIKSMTEEERENLRQRSHAASLERIKAKAQQKQKLKDALESGQHVIIDLDFAAQMTREQIVSLCQQLAFCHSINSAASTPAHLEFTSMGNAVGSTLRNQVSGVQNWPVTMTEGSYIEKYASREEDLVYLTADAKDVLTSLQSGKSYIIGGIVDRNRLKGLCEGKARQQGIKTAKLPIGDHVQLAGNKVLTVNQVLQMLVEWMDCKNWPSAIQKALPARKLQKDASEVGDAEIGADDSSGRDA